MQLQQFSQCYPLESTEAPRVLILKELLCLLRRKALNHTQSILRATLYVNHKSRSLHPSVGAACRGLRSTGCGFCPFPPVPLPVFNFFLDENLRRAYSNSWVKLRSNPGTPASLAGVFAFGSLLLGLSPLFATLTKQTGFCTILVQPKS